MKVFNIRKCLWITLTFPTVIVIRGRPNCTWREPLPQSGFVVICGVYSSDFSCALWFAHINGRMFTLQSFRMFAQHIGRQLGPSPHSSHIRSAEKSSGASWSFSWADDKNKPVCIPHTGLETISYCCSCYFWLMPAALIPWLSLRPVSRVILKACAWHRTVSPPQRSDLRASQDTPRPADSRKSISTMISGLDHYAITSLSD